MVNITTTVEQVSRDLEVIKSPTSLPLLPLRSFGLLDLVLTPRLLTESSEVSGHPANHKSTNSARTGARQNLRRGRADENSYVYIVFFRREFGSALLGMGTNKSDLDLLGGQNFISECVKISFGNG